MKFLFAAISGFALTVGVFVGGVAFAISYLSADPVPVHMASIEPNPEFLADVRKIDVTAQDFERVAPTPTRRAMDDKARNHAIDDIATSALPEEAPLHTISPEHVAWCERRYRSYDAETNSYRPYSGGTRECVSPFTSTRASQEPENVEYADLTEPFEQADLGTVSLNSSHLAICASRYRSYRAEDNTYQPYGGGPRMACQ